MFFLEELQSRGLRPQRLISTGMRIFQLRLGGRNQREVWLKDSLNFFACPLSSLPEVFGLEVPEKPYFPYLYIREANLHVQLDGLPPAELYDPNGMRPAQRASFLAWYAEQQQQRPPVRFVLADQLLEYCGNDVRILRAAALRFRQLVGRHAAGMDPFEAASTSAGLALAIFRQCYLRPEWLVHSPEGGYQRGRRASAASRRFFWVLEKVWNERNNANADQQQQQQPLVHIQTAEWSIGEAQVDDCGYRLDGLLHRPPPQRSLAIEFNGCYYHGRGLPLSLY